MSDFDTFWYKLEKAAGGKIGKVTMSPEQFKKQLQNAYNSGAKIIGKQQWNKGYKMGYDAGLKKGQSNNPFNAFNNIFGDG